MSKKRKYFDQAAKAVIDGVIDDGEINERGGTTTDILEIRKLTKWQKVPIPERIVKKLARIAGLEYVDGHSSGGGGLCIGIGTDSKHCKVRRLAFHILGKLVGNIGSRSTDDAIEGTGVSWMDVEWWREDEEYALLWRAAQRVRREVAASRVEDELWDRALNGFDHEEVRRSTVGEGYETTKVKRIDNNLGINLLKSMGYTGAAALKGVVRKANRVEHQKRRGAFNKESGLVNIGVDGGAESTDNVSNVSDEVPGHIDTVLFMDRKTAFKSMGGKLPNGADVERDGEVDHKGGDKVSNSQPVVVN